MLIRIITRPQHGPCRWMAASLKGLFSPSENEQTLYVVVCQLTVGTRYSASQKKGRMCARWCCCCFAAARMAKTGRILTGWRKPGLCPGSVSLALRVALGPPVRTLGNCSRIASHALKFVFFECYSPSINVANPAKMFSVCPVSFAKHQ